MQLQEAVPWGRSAGEYIRMFALTPEDQGKRILDCAGGPSSFTFEQTREGKSVVSCDPLYRFTAGEIRQRIQETAPRLTALTEANKANFLWDMYGSPAELAQIRKQAMRLFLEDYDAGKEQGRYIPGELPHLPFATGSFELTLCSHLLFTYSEQFSQAFHVQSVLEMARVAREVRVFPLLNAFRGEPSPHLSAVMERLQEQGCATEICPVHYEFQKGGNKMLRVVNSSAASGA